MRIGVVSDTHDNLPNVERIVEIFRASRVERIVHTGDITRAETLDRFGSLAVPLHGVYGNNDVDRRGLAEAAGRHGFRLEEPPLRLEWAGRRIVVVHDPRDLVGDDGRFGRIAGTAGGDADIDDHIEGDGLVEGHLILQGAAFGDAVGDGDQV